MVLCIGLQEGQKGVGVGDGASQMADRVHLFTYMNWECVFGPFLIHYHGLRLRRFHKRCCGKRYDNHHRRLNCVLIAVGLFCFFHCSQVTNEYSIFIWHDSHNHANFVTKPPSTEFTPIQVGGYVLLFIPGGLPLDFDRRS